MSSLSQVKRLREMAEKITSKVKIVFVDDVTTITTEMQEDKDTIYLYLEL